MEIHQYNQMKQQQEWGNDRGIYYSYYVEPVWFSCGSRLDFHIRQTEEQWQLGESSREQQYYFKTDREED